jgi:hypothetical protein
MRIRFKLSLPRVSPRRLAIWAALAVGMVALGAIALIAGKGHRFLLDNTKDGEAQPLRFATIRVDGGEPIELTRGIRDIKLVMGQRHSLTFDFMDGSEPVTLDYEFPLDLEYAIVYATRVKAGRPDWVEPFDYYSRNPPPKEEEAPPVEAEAVPSP